MQKIDKSESKIVKVMEHLISRKFDHYCKKLTNLAAKLSK
jgi:hypothetical protein